MIALCEAAPAARRRDAREALGDLFLKLASGAEHDIRLRLAARLADADWPPPALMRMLALDDIDIARPVIAASPVLADADLLAVLARATLEHQLAVAQRPGLGAAVVEAVVQAGDPLVMAALAGNDRTVLPPDAMRRLVEASRRVAALRAPLARRPELSAELARGLYAWVGEALRRVLCERFALEPAELDPALAAAVREAHAGISGAPPSPPFHDEQDEMEQRLIGKLEASGQLKPGYLLRALRDGKLSLFEGGLAALAGFSRAQVRRALACDRPERLAAACAAVGLDRSAFPTLLALVRSLNGDRPGERPDSAATVAAAFAARDRQAAAQAFRELDRRAGGA